jgi:hypothetical protein
VGQVSVRHPLPQEIDKLVAWRELPQGARDLTGSPLAETCQVCVTKSPHDVTKSEQLFSQISQN